MKLIKANAMKRHTLKTTILSLFTTLFIMGTTTSLASSNLDTVTVEDKSFPQHEVFDAVIEAIHHSTVSSRIASEVIEINYDVNDFVPKGALIIKFRDEEFQARVAQMQASLLADDAQINETLARQKEALLENKRIKNLFKRKLTSQASLDSANANLSAADAKVLAVKAQRKAHKAQLSEAMVQLSYTKIIAPYGGVVVERFIEIGEMASPGQHLITGVSLEQLRAIVKVPQYLLSAIKSAKTPVLHLTDGREITANKITIIPQANNVNHSFKVRVDLPKGLDNIYPGLFAKLYFNVGDESIRAIPQVAIVQRSEVSGVYVQAKNKTITFRQVRLGRHLQNEQREILAGLSSGEQVILDPIQASKTLKSNNSGNTL